MPESTTSLGYYLFFSEIYLRCQNYITYSRQSCRFTSFYELLHKYKNELVFKTPFKMTMSYSFYASMSAMKRG